ncbi:class Ib ribonucleoside-diphosphate reductase assembly flavoprotein NrdI [Paenibacillus sp. M1]|uniref:Protein NrdI n=1 Tax=Paenibacillus haidiansis TaxID=1574488 RepID=A0ABU7VVR4_9BACL
MVIAYDSKTGNVRRFIQKLDAECVQIDEDMSLDTPFVLVTYTTGFGQVPEKVQKFLARNHKQLQAVAASGNRNWGQCFAMSADKIASQYEVPVLYKFELSGTPLDVTNFQERMSSLEAYRAKQ